MPVRILINQYDVTGGRQNFARPFEVPKGDFERIQDKRVLKDDTYKAGNKHYESIFWSEWNSTVPRQNYIDLISGINNGLYSLSTGDFVRYGMVSGVSYEEFAEANGKQHYAVKVDSLNKHFSCGTVVYDGVVDSTVDVITDQFKNENDKQLTLGIHVLGCEKCAGGLDVRLARGNSSIRGQNPKNPITVIRRPGGYLFETNNPNRDYSHLEFRASPGSSYQILAFIGVYS